LQHPSYYRFCGRAQKELQKQRKLHKARPHTLSDHHVNSKNISSGKSYTSAAANHLPVPPPTDTHSQKNTAEQVPEKCTDSKMVTLITTVQKIMTRLQRADTVEDRFALIMRTVYGLVMLT
jgi:hypothetical protein